MPQIMPMFWLLIMLILFFSLFSFYASFYLFSFLGFKSSKFVKPKPYSLFW